jgi:hypothetical protein
MIKRYDVDGFFPPEEGPTGQWCAADDVSEIERKLRQMITLNAELEAKVVRLETDMANDPVYISLRRQCEAYDDLATHVIGSLLDDNMNWATILEYVRAERQRIKEMT